MKFSVGAQMICVEGDEVELRNRDNESSMLNASCRLVLEAVRDRLFRFLKAFRRAAWRSPLTMITANPYQPPNVDAAMPVIDEQRRRARHLLRGVLIWFLALPLLESVAAWIRWAGARQVDVDRWNRALYRSLNPAIYLAMAGALLWTVWVIGFYFLGVDFTVISWLVGVPAHLLAACLYLPLLYRWYRLAQSDGEDESSPTKPTDSLSKS